MEEPKENPPERTQEEIDLMRKKIQIEVEESFRREKWWRPKTYGFLLILHVVSCGLALSMVTHMLNEAPDSYWKFTLGILAMLNLVTGYATLNRKYELMGELEKAEGRIRELE